MSPWYVVVDGLYLRETLDDKRADGSLLGFAHPTEWQVVRVGVEGIWRTEGIVLALVSAPEESIALQIERRFQTFSFVESLRQKEDDRLILRRVQLRTVGVLLI